MHATSPEDDPRAAHQRLAHAFTVGSMEPPFFDAYAQSSLP